VPDVKMKMLRNKKSVTLDLFCIVWMLLLIGLDEGIKQILRLIAYLNVIYLDTDVTGLIMLA
jgi:hypothetical protein